MACGSCAKKRAAAFGERRTASLAEGVSPQGTKIFFYAKPPSDEEAVEVRFPTLGEARSFVKEKGNTWTVEQRRERVTSVDGNGDKA